MQKLLIIILLICFSCSSPKKTVTIERYEWVTDSLQRKLDAYKNALKNCKNAKDTNKNGNQ